MRPERHQCKSADEDSKQRERRDLPRVAETRHAGFTPKIKKPHPHSVAARPDLRRHRWRMIQRKPQISEERMAERRSHYLVLPSSRPTSGSDGGASGGLGERLGGPPSRTGKAPPASSRFVCCHGASAGGPRRKRPRHS